jgi:hypothetical protein
MYMNHVCACVSCGYRYGTSGLLPDFAFLARTGKKMSVTHVFDVDACRCGCNYGTFLLLSAFAF